MKYTIGGLLAITLTASALQTGNMPYGQLPDDHAAFGSFEESYELERTGSPLDAAVKIFDMIESDSSTDDPLFTITPLNTWSLNYAGNILGLDYLMLGSEPVIGLVSSVDDCIYFARVTDMTSIAASSLHGDNTSAFGCTATPPGMTTTDFNSPSIYYGLWSSWSFYDNPAGSHSRGITRDVWNDVLWVTYKSVSSQYIGSMTEGTPGSIEWHDASDGLPSSDTITGLTDFLLSNGNTCLAYLTYDSDRVRFQEFTGSDLDYLGYAVLPYSCSTSLGICYCSSRESFYWSYKSNGNYYITEMAINITALQRETWAGIKTMF